MLTNSETFPRYSDERNVKLKYPWQQLVLDAFMEPDSKKVLRTVAEAEREIAARLHESTLPESEEYIALGEAFLAWADSLSRLESKPKSQDQKGKRKVKIDA